MRKYGASAVLAAALMMFSGCSAPKYHYEVRKDLSVYFGNADSVIQSVREAFRERCPKITIEYVSHSDNMEDIAAVVNELVTFAMSETDDPCEGDYLYHQYGGYELGYSRSEISGGRYSYTVTIVPGYYTTTEQEKQVTARVNETVGKIGSECVSDLDKVKAVYDYIYENVDYDRVHAKNEHYHLKTTAYAALIQKSAVCQGYSVLMYRMLRELGVDCRVITGMALGENSSEYHAWNIVRLGGTYYNIDITWDRQTESRGWFLKGDRTFSADHIRDTEYSTEEFYGKYPMSEEDMNI